MKIHKNNIKIYKNSYLILITNFLLTNKTIQIFYYFVNAIKTLIINKFRLINKNNKLLLID